MALGNRLPKYIAFLRGINVGGHRIKMPALEQIFVDMKLKDVSSFIASGNVIFSTRSETPAVLEERIEKQLLAQLGYAVPTFLRTTDELNAVLATSANISQSSHAGSSAAVSGDAKATMMIGFVKESISSSIAKKLKSYETETDTLDCNGREIYWMCHGRISDSTVPWPKLSKLLSIESTFRNSTTLTKLAAVHSA